jgi:hypothetical protein
MKKIIFLLMAGLIDGKAHSQSGSVGIGTTTPNTSAALEIQSTTKGVLIPRMSSVQRSAISSPATGLLVYDNTTNSFWFKGTGDWVELTDTANSVWKKNGTNAYVNVPGNAGIGTTSPQFHLEINKPNPSIGLTDADTNEFSGSVSGNSNSLNINAARVLVGQGTPGNLLLQTNSFLAAAGNVGIGTTTPSSKLDVSGDIKTSGNINVTNGKIGIGFPNPVQKLEVNGSMVVSNFITRPPTGLSNLVPICYGIVNANGDVAGGTGNFSAVDITSLGALQAYKVDVNNVIVNLNTDIVIVTPFNPVDGANLTTSVYSPSILGLGGGGFLAVFRLAEGSNPIISRTSFSFMVFRP